LYITGKSKFVKHVSGWMDVKDVLRIAYSNRNNIFLSFFCDYLIIFFLIFFPTPKAPAHFPFAELFKLYVHVLKVPHSQSSLAFLT
jgi:hypothetical protein